VEIVVWRFPGVPGHATEVIDEALGIAFKIAVLSDGIIEPEEKRQRWPRR
jgi:hypothetical protein